MAPHAGFSRHVQNQRSPSPPETSSMDSAPNGASGAAAGRHQMLNPSPLVPTSEWLPMELTFPEYLTSLTGVEDLNQLRHLKLRVIARETSVQRISLYVPSLVHLDLQGSCLGSLRDLGCGLLALEVLSVSRCGLGSLDGTYGFPSLKDLNASYNSIKDVGPCSALENLRFLDVRGNQIRDIECIASLCICPKLEELILSECPITKAHHYRRRVLRMLPSLMALDTQPAADGHSSPDEGSALEEDEDASGDSEDEPKWDSSASEERREEGTHALGEGEDSRSVSPVTQSESELNERSVGVVRPDRKPLLARAASARARLQTSLPPNNHSAFASSIPRKRPQTARPHANRSGVGEEDSIIQNSVVISDESPSSLTSGVAMCGNIAAVLLSNRARVRAAGTSDPLSLSRSATAEGLGGDSRDDILEASRKWRAAYALFRHQNRKKWEREAEEEDGGNGAL